MFLYLQKIGEDNPNNPYMCIATNDSAKYFFNGALKQLIL